MNLGAVLFDLDDTLHDKSATLTRVGTMQYESAELAALGVPLEPWLAHYLELNNQRIEKAEVFSNLAARFNLTAAVQQALLEDFDLNFGKLAIPHKGARELLAWCKSSGLKVGVVTNGRDAFQRSKIAGMGLEGLIDATFSSGGFGVKKPDHAIFLACLAQLGVPPEAAAFVGDDFQADMEPALQIGMVAVWKSTGWSDQVAFSSMELKEIQAYLRSKM